MSKTNEEIKTEIADLEKELRAHEGYLHRNWLSGEGYKKWYARKQSLVGKIERRKRNVGIYMSDTEFQVMYDELDEKDHVSESMCKDKKYQNQFTRHQQNKMTNLIITQHHRNSNYY